MKSTQRLDHFWIQALPGCLSLQELAFASEQVILKVGHVLITERPLAPHKRHSKRLVMASATVAKLPFSHMIEGSRLDVYIARSCLVPTLSDIRGRWGEVHHV